MLHEHSPWAVSDAKTQWKDCAWPHFEHPKRQIWSERQQVAETNRCSTNSEMRGNCHGNAGSLVFPLTAIYTQGENLVLTVNIQHANHFSNSAHIYGVVSFSPDQGQYSSSLCLHSALSKGHHKHSPFGRRPTCPVICFAVPTTLMALNKQLCGAGWKQFIIICGHCLVRNIKQVMHLLSKFHSWMIRRMDNDRNSHSTATVVDYFCSFVSSPDCLPQDNKHGWRRSN